jgi:hypothetical protein
VRKFFIAAVVAVTAVTGVSVFAIADDGKDGTSWTFTFTARTAATATGSNSIIEPAKVDDKGTADESDDRYVAPAVSTIRFPVGSGINTTVYPVCKASPSDVQRGAAKCPANTKIGSGLANSVIGQNEESKGTELVAPIEAFNRKNEILFHVRPCAPGSGPGKPKPCEELTASTVVLIGKWAKVTTQPTLTVKTPPALLRGGVTITRFQLKTAKKVKKITRTIDGKKTIIVRSYATTPGKCPKSKVWKSSATEQYEDGSKHTIPDSQTCRN